MMRFRRRSLRQQTAQVPQRHRSPLHAHHHRPPFGVSSTTICI